MDEELTKADKALDKWMAAQHKADDEASRHKHETAAKVGILAEKHGITKAKEIVYGDDDWIDNQIQVNRLSLEAQLYKHRYEQAIRRWEQARSEFSATRRI